jgi:hypothetical protein
VYYNDNTALYGYNLPFAVGTHAFQQVSGTLVPTRPIRELRYAFRGCLRNLGLLTL